MKKILCFVLCLLLMPVVVNAIMASPSISDYVVIVNNENGVQLYDYNDVIVSTIPYGTLLTITDEYIEDNALYGYTSYNGYSGHIDLSNTGIYSTEVDFTSFTKGNGTKVYVFKDGCFMFSGPSQIYGKNGVEIPVGTTLEILYYDELWSYVEYNGVGGWIYTYYYESVWDYYDNLDVAVAHFNTDDSKFITVKNLTTIYDDSFKNLISIDVPELTILESDYHLYLNYHITYNGVSGWVHAGSGDDSVMSVDEENILTYDEVTLYERNGNAAYTKTSVVLPVNYKTQALCWLEYDGANLFGDDMDIYEKLYLSCQISYNDDVYYVVSGSDYTDSKNSIESPYVSERTSNYYVVLDKAMDLYDEINGNVIATIPDLTALKVEYWEAYVDDDAYIYVTYNDVSGWLKYDEEYMTDYYEDDEELKYYLYANNDTPCEPDYCETDFDEIDNTHMFKNILVASLIILSIIVLIIYINKKKDKKGV